MHRQIRACLMLALAGLGCWAAPSAKAQEPSGSSTAKVEDVRNSNTYRLDFSVIEVEDGKKINTRQYSVILQANRTTRDVKIGTRVPVESVKDQLQYLDLGTNIRCLAEESGPYLSVTIAAEFSSLAASLPDSQRTAPVVRQVVIDAAGLLPLGKPTVVGSADDPGSKRQFQLEVTVTKLR